VAVNSRLLVSPAPSPVQVELENPITEIGEHVVHVKLERGLEASLVVTVEPR
jgi:ribosomal protein L9